MYVLFHVPQIHISHPSYVYMGQTDAFVTYPSPILDPCTAYIRPHVCIYVCHIVCVHTHKEACWKYRLYYRWNLRMHVHKLPLIICVFGEMNGILMNVHSYITTVLSVPIHSHYIHKFMDIEHTRRWYLRTHVRKLPTLLCV